MFILGYACINAFAVIHLDDFFFLMIRRPPRSTLDRSSAASDVYKRQPNPVHIYDESGVYQTTLTVTNDCGTSTLQQTVTVTGAPQALFSSSTQYGCAPLVVQFTNQSGGNPTSFAWVFEGGSPGTSSQPNPVVTYNAPGLYDVQLTVENPTGDDVLLLSEYIEVESPTISGFNFAVNGLQTSFTNQSINSTGSSWNFGDGFTSNETNPVHVLSLIHI